MAGNSLFKGKGDTVFSGKGIKALDDAANRMLKKFRAGGFG